MLEDLDTRWGVDWSALTPEQRVSKAAWWHTVIAPGIRGVNRHG